MSRRLMIAGGLLVLLAGLGTAGSLVFVRLRSASSRAHALVKEGAVLLDVRTPAEFQAGHLPGAINIPVAELRARVAELGPRTTPVVTYCHSGVRSTRAAATLRGLGFSEVLNLGPQAAW